MGKERWEQRRQRKQKTEIKRRSGLFDFFFFFIPCLLREMGGSGIKTLLGETRLTARVLQEHQGLQTPRSVSDCRYSVVCM